MIFTHAAGNQNVRYRLVGSVTGFDGEGDNLKPFVSNSGRIRIDPGSFPRNKHEADAEATEYVEVKGNCRLMWSIRPAYVDVVHNTPQRPGEVCTRYNVPYRYQTLFDGLPPGEHVLTLVPEDGNFAIESLEVHHPPLRTR